MKLEQHFSHQISHSLHVNGVRTLPSTNQYLTSMLIKFVDSEKLFVDREPLLIELMKSQKQPGKLHDIGDRCLFLTGYFYDSLRRMGKGGISKTRESRELYDALSGLFHPLSVAIGDLHLPLIGEKDTIELYSKWVQTHDSRYKHTLKRLGIQVDTGRN